GMKGTSSLTGALAFQLARPATSSAVTMKPSRLRSMDSRSTLMEKGSLSTRPMPASFRALRLKYVYSPWAVWSVERAPKGSLGAGRVAMFGLRGMCDDDQG